MSKEMSDYEKRSLKEIHLWKKPNLTWSGKAMEYLTQAVNKGFSSADLMLNDPAFNKIKNKYSFKMLIKKVGKIIKSRIQ